MEIRQGRRWHLIPRHPDCPNPSSLVVSPIPVATSMGPHAVERVRSDRVGVIKRRVRADDSALQYHVRADDSALQYHVRADDSALQYHVRADDSALQYHVRADDSALQYHVRADDSALENVDRSVLPFGPSNKEPRI
jgi:hypothetical protein